MQTLRAVDGEMRMSIEKAAASLKSDVSGVKSRSDKILEKLVEKQQHTTERVVRAETKIDDVKTFTLPSRM